MQKKIYLFISAILILIFTVTYTVYGITIDEVLENKRDEIQERIDGANEQIAGVEEEISEVSEEIMELNNKISKYQDEINVLNKQLFQLEISIKESTKQLKQTEENYTYQKNLFKERVVTMYKAGETVYLDVLLHSKTLEEFISKYFYLAEMAKRDQMLMANIQRSKEQIEIKQQQLLEQQQQLQAATENKERISITLQNTKVIRNSHLNELNSKQLQFQEELAEYEQEMEELEKDILDISLSSLNEGYVGGKMRWPVPGYRTVTSPYGMRIHPIFGVLRLHTGVDISGPEYCSIVAANDGIVTVAQYSASYGNYIMIDHGGGIVTLYGHGAELVASVGDVVKAGDVIMLEGTTGWSTGPHLHFEIRVDGNTIDPLPYITNIEENDQMDLNDPMFNDITNNIQNNVNTITQN